MKTQFKRKLSLACMICLIGFWTQSAFAATDAELEQRIAALEEELKTRTESPLGALTDKITLSGAIELDYSYSDDADTGDKTSKSSESDLSLGTIELGLEANLHPYVTANVLLKGEDLDSDDKVFFDEAFFTIAKDGMPVYFIGGKRCQPFGVYESLFINDPVTQDLYEVNKTGATLGYADENLMGLDVSFTLYRGRTLVEKINDADYGVTFPTTKDSDSVNSFIVNAGIAPAEGLHLSAFFNSEPGDNDRNTTMGAAAHWDFGNFIADVEYISALNRDKDTAGKEYNEKAWTASLGYQVAEIGRASCRERV